MRRTVLIVDDSLQWASTLEIALLAISGVSVATVSTGQGALRYLQDAEPPTVGVLVTDLNMPAMDGFELIERVRSDSRYARLPIIVLSGAADPAAPEQVRRMGADAFFSKPCSPVEVRNKVEELLNACTP